ncbi:MAG: winged helix-turn-helix transcriptional regulator [Saprospiraceae bacterium]|nr:winged helix-turn-helix transcriptional regulator [Saprospiraceae bacterium]
MGNKKELFTPEQNRIAGLAKALGHPARIAILEYLLKVDACICGDIVEVLPLSQSTVSQHLKALKEVGVIKGEIEGVKTCYCIDKEAWSEIEVLFSQFFRKAAPCC